MKSDCGCGQLPRWDRGEELFVVFEIDIRLVGRGRGGIEAAEVAGEVGQELGVNAAAGGHEQSTVLDW